MRVVVLAIVLTVFLPLPGAVALEGPARVIDGDTLEIDGTPVDLFGIDAPELAQMCEHLGTPWPCGAEARNVLLGVIATRHVRCLDRGRSADGNLAAICAIGPESLNLGMVNMGMAVATADAEPDIAEGAAMARSVKRGIWSGRFTLPAEWREGKRLEPTPAAERCRIKGDIRSDGKRIYHVPGSAGYDAITIDQGRGERWFCTEMEAIRGGWNLEP